MSHAPSASDPISRFQYIFDEALQAYKNNTGIDLPSHPLFRDFTACDSPNVALTVLQMQLPGYDLPGSSQDASTNWPWLATTADVLSRVLQSISTGVDMVSPRKFGRFREMGQDHRPNESLLELAPF
jgi:hypothetical protein